MPKTLHYVFDPLCGWCYGAAVAVAALAKSEAIRLDLQPSGLFSGQGARPMDSAFAAYAWTNDQRIARLTGHVFSDRYRASVLGARNQRFDSGPATLALTAVQRTQPRREAEALQAIQRARFVEGRDVTRLDTLADILRALDLQQAATDLTAADVALQDAAHARTARAQALMHRLGARGVPTLILDTDGRQELLESQTLYADPEAFVARLTAA